MSREGSLAPSRGEEPPSGAGAAGIGAEFEHDDLYWLAVLPVAGLVVAAIIWLAPPLAGLVLPEASWKPFPTIVEVGYIRPEPIEHARFMMAVAAPFVFLAVWLALRGWRRSRRGSSEVATWYVLVVQLLITALAAVSWVAQRRAHQWFDDRTLLVAAVLGVALFALTWRGWVVPKPTATGDGRGRRLLGTGIAVMLTGYWLLPAVFRTANAVNVPASFGSLSQIQFVQDELASVLNGRTPMVDFASQYAKLLPFALAPVLAALGPSVGVTTGVLAVLGLFGLLGVYGTFVVLTEDAFAALVLYVPFLALTLFTFQNIGDERINLATLFGVVPIRVLGPFVLAWLCARQLRKGSAAARVALFAGAGLVAINNTEYGAAAFIALGLALWCGHDGQRSAWARARTLGAQAATGAVSSVIAVCALTLIRAGSLPDPSSVSNLTRVFAVEGFGMEPMPTFGLHIIIYLTFVVSLLAGVIGAVRSDDVSPQARVQHGLLAYSGLFGLGASAYWVGRSDPLALFGMFPTWGLSVAILCWAVLRRVAARPEVSTATAVRWVLPATGVLMAFGLMMTAIVQIPTPDSQLRRFTDDGPEVPQYTARVDFIAAHTVRGESVAVLAPVGHLLARDAGIVDVSPYASEASIVFYEQMDLLFGVMAKSAATKVFVGPTWPETSAYLAEKGFVTIASDPESQLTAWQRSPRPAG